jgi:IMP dehydrogenase
MNEVLTFDDIALIPNYNDVVSRKDVDTSVKLGPITLKIPLVAAPMSTVCEYRMCNALAEFGGLGILHRFMSIDEQVKQFRLINGVAGVALGIHDGIERAEALRDAGCFVFCLDVAHAHSKMAGQFIKTLRKQMPDVCILGGSVATYAGSDYLSACGADIIRCGISSGASCTTRLKTGFGIPQFFAVTECSRINKPIISDGGIRHGGDLVKCLVGGAVAGMCGSLLAGCEESPGEIIEENGRQYKMFAGMASKFSQENYEGFNNEWKTAEGESFKVPYKGSVSNIIKDLIGGLKSGCTYGGASNLEQLKRVRWVPITHAGFIEGKPHAQNRRD